MTALEDAINIGPVLAAELRLAGFATLEDLQAAGEVEAVHRLRAVNPQRDCSNSALAIAGAIRGVRWMKIPPADRRQILDDVNARPGSR
ncbi:MAG TPA: TfoX/Sxy family DNA transformation protein [Tepidiformaceae bacterium]|nr:TfoX/Sxy family DNA transformation protein [Tepidiformaceae bacterium]